MTLRDHQICELLEDGADISKRLFAVQKTVERTTNTNANIIRELAAENRRLRISQLRRMADGCSALFSRAIETSERRAPEFPPAERIIAINARIRRFRAACLAEIERLRGEG